MQSIGCMIYIADYERFVTLAIWHSRKRVKSVSGYVEGLVLDYE